MLHRKSRKIEMFKKDADGNDTDAIDSNGDLTINGGTFDITAQSAFDYDGKGVH